MVYRISGLDPAAFAHLIGADEATFAANNAVRMTADANPGYPCRVTLEDAVPGETLILCNHVSHDHGPYRASHAIFVRESAIAAATFVDEPPPVFRTRVLSVRAFDAKGMMLDARLADAGEADATIRLLFADPDVALLHVHNAVRGCFAAMVERER